MKKAVSLGTTALNYCQLTSYEKIGNEILVKVDDKIMPKTFTVTGKVLINAAGPWVDFIRKKDIGFDTSKLTLTKGVHLVLNQDKFYLNAAIYFSAPDGRMIFAIPRFDKVYIGTTDTFYEGDPQNVTVTDDDIRYLLAALTYRFPTKQFAISDVESSVGRIKAFNGRFEREKTF